MDIMHWHSPASQARKKGNRGWGGEGGRGEEEEIWYGVIIVPEYIPS
jgi:hypothetical protein